MTMSQGRYMGGDRDWLDTLRYKYIYMYVNMITNKYYLYKNLNILYKIVLQFEYIIYNYWL